MVVWIECTNSNKHVNGKMSDTITKDIIPVFIESVVFRHVGISLLIQTKEQIDFDADKTCYPLWKDGPWYNTTIC